MDDDADFTSRLSSFSISTSEEKLTQQLDTTHITPTSTMPSIFATNSLNNNNLGSLQQQQQQRNHFPNNSTNVNSTQVDNDNKWDIQKQSEGNNEEEDGWGDAPAVTAVNQDTLFGFNSIMETPEFVRKAQLANTTTYDKNCYAAQHAFQQYRNKPVSFTSAAAEILGKNQQQQHQKQ
ncbi:hypothetical protein BDF20DRAFT_836829 [Mycotypha africana]|uniref:uncharacterized protein n=1 Tax=Mycotypha africana TaxID=64632 RepID=UPI00230015F3|nr:uncharacterized protein BDF20DRAFT_836829 [Mycotypha africana]KAI8975426.1 hypothetical protein BDF20DRAFT_836829 [Mycotypha africana]